MSGVPKSRGYLAHVILVVGLLLALPLWREFSEPDHAIWNVFLAVFLLALVIAAFFGVRYLQTHDIEVGEARFTASDESNR